MKKLANSFRVASFAASTVASLVLSLFAAPLVLAAQPAPPTAAQLAEQAAMRERQERMPDSPGTGRFAAMKEEVASLRDHVIYRPSNLAGLGNTKLGLYLFGNGGCVDDGASARLHLLEVASHGYLAIAPGRIRSGPGATAAPSPPPPATANGEPSPLQVRTSYKDLLTALDWAQAQNADAKSPYYRRIDTNAVAVSGFSCGGVQALRVAGDKRVRTVIVMNSGLFTDGNRVALPEMDVPKSTLKTLHTPTLYILGGETDIAWINGTDDVKQIAHVPVFLADLKGVGHGGTYWEPNGGKAAAVVVAWLDWQLRGDTRAGRTFLGKDCGLCKDRAWVVQQKNMDEAAKWKPGGEPSRTISREELQSTGQDTGDALRRLDPRVR
ncbi:MAG: hypothetical protein ABI859_15060 [Pseudomonadota bacterium]